MMVDNRKNKRFFIGLGVTCIMIFLVLGLFLPTAWNLDYEQDDIIINPNVFIYDESTSDFEILGCTDDFVIVSSTDNITENTILCAGVTEQTPNGLLRKVKLIDPLGSGYKITTTPASLTDAIEKCDVNYSISLNPEGSYEIQSLNDEKSFFLTQQAYADSGCLNNLISIDDDWRSLSFGNQIEIALTISNDDIYMKVVNRTCAELDLSFARMDYRETLFEKSLRPLTFFVGPVPIVLLNSIDIELGIDSDCRLLSFATYAKLDKQFGFEYSSDYGLRAIHKDDSYAPEIGIGAEGELFSGEFNAGLTATYAMRLYGFAGPDLSVGIKSQTIAELQKLKDSENSSEAIVVPPFDWKLKGRLNEKITVPIKGTFKIEIPDYNPFSGKDSIVLANAEIFDSGDAITLLEIKQEFGVIDYGEEGLNGETDTEAGIFPPGMPEYFIFSSGVGAWSTDVRINPDGTFEGYYHDSNPGESGSGYVFTIYECRFSGKFSKTVKINDYEYSMKVDYLEVEKRPGEETINADGTRIVTANPYGFDNANEFRLYLPGRSTIDLPAEFLGWVNMQFGGPGGVPDTLGFFGLYNVEDQRGFFEYKATYEGGL